MAFLARKKWKGLFRGQHKYGGGQRLEVRVRSSFTVVNLHDLWSRYSGSIWHVIGLVYENRGNLGQAQILGVGHGPMPS